MTIGLSSKARVSYDDLMMIRRMLKGKSLALEHIGGMLQYANKVLVSAERKLINRLRDLGQEQGYRDQAIAIVDYGGCEFQFVRRSQ